MLTKGQIVIVTLTNATGGAGTVRAEVIHVEIPANMPVITSDYETSQVKQIMAERGIVQLAMLVYDAKGTLHTTSGGKPVTLHRGQQVMFAALRNHAGEWRDLQGQPLTIVPIEEEPPWPNDDSNSSPQQP